MVGPESAYGDSNAPENAAEAELTPEEEQEVREIREELRLSDSPVGNAMARRRFFDRRETATRKLARLQREGESIEQPEKLASNATPRTPEVDENPTDLKPVAQSLLTVALAFSRRRSEGLTDLITSEHVSQLTNAAKGLEDAGMLDKDPQALTTIIDAARRAFQSAEQSGSRGPVRESSDSLRGLGQKLTDFGENAKRIKARIRDRQGFEELNLSVAKLLRSIDTLSDGISARRRILDQYSRR